MSQEYSLKRDIVQDHNQRMLNIKKYYPFFKLQDMQFKGEKYAMLDMGYLMMAVLRFFIEENNFKEKMVTYEEYSEFMESILENDFEITFQEDEEKKLLISYIFDKLKNDGKPFSYEYYNPITKKKNVARTRILNNRIVDDKVVYYISTDAIEFYLDTKEVKEESNIAISQLLLEKMISTRNFKGGADVVSRINNEVSRLMARREEILEILTYDVFQGTKAYEDFMENTVKWFDEEQKLFKKNKTLIEEAMKNSNASGEYSQAARDIFKLEEELNIAINKHGELLNACATLQDKVDDLVEKAKISRIRASMDFKKLLNRAMDSGDSKVLESFVKPLFALNTRKMFSPIMIDNLLTYPTGEEEVGEKVISQEEIEDFKYPDEIEDERIRHNLKVLTYLLCNMVKKGELFTALDFIDMAEKVSGEGIKNNGDFYTFLVHLMQKKSVDVSKVLEKPDTFLEGIIKEVLENDEEAMSKYKGLKFTIVPGRDEIKLQKGVIQDFAVDARGGN